MESRVRVLQADALIAPSWTGAVVRHCDNEVVSVSPRVNGDLADAGHLADSVFHGVFDDRLKDEIRHERVARAIRHRHVDVEFSLKSDLHQLDVLAQEIQFFMKRHFLLRALLEGVAEEVAESCDHATNAAWITLDERRDGIQRIEKEVRVELRT